MASIYIHIGLPKTGTTTLQKSFFQSLKNFDYQGVYQPRRSKKPGDAYQTAISVFNKEISYFEIINLAKKTNKEHHNNKILISEEMFCVGVDWVEKNKEAINFH